jgi:ubiquinone/menaquinone biosynthesis C-methylase UbiE
MNYGYAPKDAEIEGRADSEYLCLELYRHVASREITDSRVLEVSSGRGGGAFFLMGTFRPAEYIGIDLSEENVRIANERFGGTDGLEFRVGNAEDLAFADESFDAVLNIEASHLYPNPSCFFAEVARVLRPGGLFFYADLFWPDSDPESMLREAGLVIRQSQDVTPNVLRSLELDSDRREALLEPGTPEEKRLEFCDWAGIKGYRAYNRFASGEWTYRSFVVSRPAPGSPPSSELRPSD